MTPLEPVRASSNRLTKHLRCAVVSGLTAFLLVSPLHASSTGTSGLFMPQGSSAGSADGDYIASSNPGLGAPYHYFIEVPPGLSRLRVQLFDADVGAGGPGEADLGRDRQRGGSWDTTANYTLYDPSGASVATMTGNSAGPSGADGNWLNLYDSSTVTTYPTFVGSNTATTPAGTGGTPTFINSNTNTTTVATTSVLVTAPAGTSTGDVLVAVVLINAATTPNPITGWTLQDDGACGTGGFVYGGPCEMGVYTRTASGTSADNVTFTWTGNYSAIGAVLCYRGATSIDVDGSSGSGAAPLAPSITASSANSVILRFAGVGDNTTVTDAGLTERYNVQLDVSGYSDLTSVGAEGTQVSSGPTGTYAFVSPYRHWRAVTLALGGGAKTGGGGTSLSVAIPSGTVGDLLIGSIVLDAAASDVTTPTGWTLQNEGNCPGAPATCRMEIYTRTAQAGDTSVLFNWGATTRQGIGAVLRYSGSSGTPVSGASTGTSTAPSAPSVTAPAHSIVLRFAAVGSAASITTPGGLTSRFNVTVTDPVGSAGAEGTQAAAGASGTANFTLGSSANWRTATLAFGSSNAVAHGHWELTVDETGGGNDLNALGIRADDGDESLGGAGAQRLLRHPHPARGEPQRHRPEQPRLLPLSLGRQRLRRQRERFRLRHGQRHRRSRVVRGNSALDAGQQHLDQHRHAPPGHRERLALRQQRVDAQQFHRLAELQ